jgi:hypothetical protein
MIIANIMPEHSYDSVFKQVDEAFRKNYPDT